MSKAINDSKVEAVISIHILRKESLIELKERSGETPPRYVAGFGMTGKGWGTVCCLTDLNLDELKGLRDYIDLKLKERVK